MKKYEAQLITGKRLEVIQEEVDGEKESTAAALVRMVQDIGEEGLQWVRAQFGGYARKELDLKVISLPEFGQQLQLECRFQMINKKQAKLKVNSFVREGQRSKRKAQMVYQLRLGEGL